MLVRRTPPIPEREITDEKLYLRRREFVRLLGAGAVAAGAAPWLQACSPDPAVDDFSLAGGPAVPPGQSPLANVKPKVYTVDEPLNAFEDITSYNNFYEFGMGKDDPQRHAGRLTTSPWKVKIDGHCAKPAEYQLEDLIRPHQLEERIYRLRCVEAWSMVIPWVGFPLADVIKRVEPTSRAKFVEFYTLHDRGRMPMQRTNILEWPYVEGLRLDEAMHPLTIFSVGIYDEVLPPQNGAPIRLVVPWKYGFKSIKSIVRMRFVENQPKNTWQVMAPHEYGFYANVNPQVDHPRWSQARERRLPELIARTPTRMFNGYDQVASLYSGMDLRKNY